MKRHHTPPPPVKIRMRDFLALPQDHRATGLGNEVLIKSAHGRMVPAQVIP